MLSAVVADKMYDSTILVVCLLLTFVNIDAMNIRRKQNIGMLQTICSINRLRQSKLSLMSNVEKLSRYICIDDVLITRDGESSLGTLVPRSCWTPTRVSHYWTRTQTRLETSRTRTRTSGLEPGSVICAAENSIHVYLTSKLQQR
jgi:hypothetical protein